MATTSLANRSASVTSEPEATSDGYVGASLCWRYARISLVSEQAERSRPTNGKDTCESSLSSLAADLFRALYVV